MGLEVSKTAKSGFEGTYLFMSKFEIEYKKRVANVYFELYKDRDVSLDPEGTSIETHSYTWAGDEFPFDDIKEDPRAVAYTKAKELRGYPETAINAEGEEIWVGPGPILWPDAKDVFEEGQR